MRIPIRRDRSAGHVRTLWRSSPLDLPDGIAVARSGHIYVALLGPSANRIVELSSTGHPIGTIPAPGSSSPVPFDSPSSVVFSGRRLLVTTISYFANTVAHRAILAVDTAERPAPTVLPRPGRSHPKERRGSASTDR
jgi:sugar lactone lactonase YvrE